MITSEIVELGSIFTLLRLLSDAGVSSSSITKTAVSEFSKINHRALAKWKKLLSWKRVDWNFQMLSDTSCFSQLHIKLLGPDSYSRCLKHWEAEANLTHRKIRVMLACTLVRLFPLLSSAKSHHEMFLEASIHKHKNRVEHVCNKGRWQQFVICSKRIKNEMQNWHAVLKT